MNRRKIRATLAVMVVAALTSLGCGELVAGPDPSTDALTVFDAAANEIDLHYPFFAQSGRDWPALVAIERQELRATSSDTRLRTTLCTLTELLRNYHTTLTTPSGTCAYTGVPYPPNFSRSLLTAAVPALRLTRSAQMSYAVIGGDIGYIYIPSFLGQGWGDEIDDILDAFGPVHGLIIDIRNNGGGNGGNALAIASRLADQEHVYQYGYFRNGPGHDDFTDGIPQSVVPRGRTHFSGPVALLTNRGNGSAAEDFVAMLRVIPTTFTVGDTTIGNSSNPLWRTLPNGWQLRIPQSKQLTPDGFNAEGVGYPPTYPVRLEQADFDRNHDTIIDRALAELRSR
jgi:Periplasmic protease